MEKKSIYDVLIAELSILYEIASISSQETEEKVAKEVMERAIRLFGVHYFALVSSGKVLISYGFRKMEEIWKRIEKKKANQIHFVFKVNEEQIVLFMEQALPIQDRQRRLYNIFARRLEKALLATKNQNKLIETEKLAGAAQIAAEIAHEIKNPLAVIKASLYYLKRILPKEQEEAQRKLFQIDKATERAVSYIDNLLSFSKAPVLNIRKIKINEVIEEALEELSPEILASVEIEKVLSPHLPEIEADPERLKQVFTNIIKNAKESMEGVEVKELRIETKEENGFVRISISDTGKGIREENLEHIFDPFFTTKGKGTGLGLAICKRIIEAHNGKIEVVSELGKGTTFIIRLQTTDIGNRYSALGTRISPEHRMPNTENREI